MSGDYSRWSFDPQRHFGAVLMQQGRVHTDADWNEWVEAALRRAQADSLDTLGAAVVPRETPEGFRILAAGGALTIGRGRMYVDGLLVENHGEAPQEWDPRLAELRGTAPTPYLQQPYLPQPAAVPAGGPHVVYLKAWQRERTAIEEPSLIEPALGIDTTTRLQAAWQVKILPNVGAGVTCATELEDVPGFAAAEPAAAGRLTTSTAEVAGEPDPCRVPPSGDYKGLENQLYRVEVHKAGGLTGAGRATFKWSRDNATVATRVPEIPALDRLVVESIGRDDVLGFSDGDWVEITDDHRELAGLPGDMRRIQSGGGVDEATRTIRLTQPVPAGAFPTDAQGRTAPERNTRIRRWDQQGRVVNATGGLAVDLDAGGADGTIPVAGGATQILLENGVVVTFALDPGTGTFRTGDHWVFAARTADASVEILDAAPPRGIHAHYAKLALVTLPDAETDCRTLWPPEVVEGGGCDCTVCVTPESHASGALTVAAAVEQVKETGGTVCLAAGRYLLDGPVDIDGARSVRVRGQGLATVLVAAGGGTVIGVRRSFAVTIENLTALTSEADAIRLERCLDVTLRRCFVVSPFGAAVRLASFLLGPRIQECVLAADRGVLGGDEKDDDAFVVTAALRIEASWLWCRRSGIDLGRLAIHLADTRIAGNTIWGCRQAGVIANGGSFAGPFDVVANALSVRGAGILAGVDALRVADNDVRGGRGDGIELVHGLDAGGVDHCQVLANRVRGFTGAGVAVHTRVNSAMIKHNVIAEIGGSGIELSEDGSAGVLVVDNNQLLDVAREEVDQSERAPYVAAISLVSVEELDVAGNTVQRAGAQAWLASGTAGILAVAAASARIAGNRLLGIGPAERSVAPICGIHVGAPFAATTVAGNTLRRRADADQKLQAAEWIGLLVGHGGRDPKDGFASFGKIAVVSLENGPVVLTATTAFGFAGRRLGDLAVEGNEIVLEESVSRPLMVLRAALCELSQNRIRASGDRPDPSVVRAERAIVSGNDLRGPERAEVLHLVVETDAEEEPAAAVVGNLRTGDITLNGNPLDAPWKQLNPFIAS